MYVYIYIYSPRAPLYKGFTCGHHYSLPIIYSFENLSKKFLIIPLKVFNCSQIILQKA